MAETLLTDLGEETPVVPTEGAIPVLHTRFPEDATDEEVAVYMTILAERVWIDNGVTPEQIAAAAAADPDAGPIVQANQVEIHVGSPVVLWHTFRFVSTPEPDTSAMRTVGSWIWSCAKQGSAVEA